MFRKYYKAANDEIKTNRELIDKIFDEYTETEEKRKSRLYSVGARYGMAFAAIFVLSIALLVYPQITKLNEEPIVTEQPNYINKADTGILSETDTKSGDGTENKLVINDYTAPNVQESDSEPKTGETEVSEAKMVEPQQDIVDSHNENDFSAELQSDSNNEIRLAANTYEERNGQLSNLYEIEISAMKTITDDEIRIATNILEEKLGKSDENTGNLYIFDIAGKLETEGGSYYLGRWKWLVDDHTSLLCEFVLSCDFNGLYKCAINDNKVQWNTDTNMF